MAQRSTAPVPTKNRLSPGEMRLPMSYDEYQEWFDKGAGRFGEWVDGEVIVFVSATFLHERMLTFISALLSIFLDLRRIGIVLGGASYEVRTHDGAARLPDLLVVLNEHQDRITEQRLVGAADVAVEIVSPESAARDRRDKLAEYAAVGIPEYWIIDPREGKEAIELFVLTSDGFYEAVSPDIAGRLHSLLLPGVWLDPNWLTAEELPSVIDLAFQMAGVPLPQRPD